MAKVAITVNGADERSIFPTFVLGSAAVAGGDDVVLFFEPDGAPALVKGALENINSQAKGWSDLMGLLEGFQILGGRIMLCELAFGVKGIKREDLREGVEVVDAPTFLDEARDAQLTFSF
ncbi:MAG: DsrE/DsrF/DrsH-like family protein [Dehalococcoidia bacterium]